MGINVYHYSNHSILQPNYVGEDNDGLDSHAIHDGMDELKVRLKLRSQLVCAHELHSQTWDWRYGQTPEFTYTFSQSFEWGETVGVKTCVRVRFVYTAF